MHMEVEVEGLRQRDRDGVKKSKFSKAFFMDAPLVDWSQILFKKL